MASAWSASGFPDELFDPILANLEKPSLEGFDLFTDCKGVQIYRQAHPESGLYQYKIVGVDSDLDAETCSRVYRDLDYRRQWDSYVGELRKEKEENDVELIYWLVKYPFPLWSRDYVFGRRTREIKQDNGTTVWITVGRSCTSDEFPEKDGVVRVDDFSQTLAIMANTDGPGARLYMEYYDNPKGSIPTWLINFMASSGVASYLDDVKKACQGYGSR